MNKEEFLISINIICQSLNTNEINIYSKKQLEQNYSINIESYLNSKSTITQLLNEKDNLIDLIHIIFSLINLHQKKIKRDFKKIIKKDFFSNEQIFEKLNSILNNVNLSFRIDNLKEPNLEKNSESYIDSIWIYLSELIANKYLMKICNYPKCDIIFISRRKSSSYCNSKCQTRAKSFRAYHSDEDNYKSKEEIINIEPKENLDASKLSPEKFFIPEKYDVDFGFFDDEITKRRILGS
tara:strand:+ start:1341 stop:2054 length:714 start_codon:yes stop_codon:yes gene_type:complete